MALTLIAKGHVKSSGKNAAYMYVLTLFWKYQILESCSVVASGRKFPENLKWSKSSPSHVVPT